MVNVLNSGFNTSHTKYNIIRMILSKYQMEYSLNVYFYINIYVFTWVKKNGTNTRIKSTTFKACCQTKFYLFIIDNGIEKQIKQKFTTKI